MDYPTTPKSFGNNVIYLGTTSMLTWARGVRSPDNVTWLTPLPELAGIA